MKSRLLSIIIFIVFIILFSCNISRRENFDNTSATMVFTTFKDNNSEWIYKNIKGKLFITEINPDSWNNFKNICSSDPTKFPTTLYSGNSFYICDPYDYDNDFSKFKIIGKSEKGYFIGLTTPQTGFGMTCILDILDKTVGYFDHSDLYFIKSIIAGYRMDSSRITLKQLYRKNYIDLPYTLTSGVDVIITFVIPNNPFYYRIQTQSISIMGFVTLDWERVRLFYPYTTKEIVTSLSQIFLSTSGASALVMSREENTFLPSMRLNIISLYDTSNPPQIIEDFITRLDNDSSYYDPSYRCYGDSNINNKALCDSPYDVIGASKIRYTVWDQPCIVDTDCPYYNSDKKRGGCLEGGVCEFPVGVKGIAYRKNLNTGPFAPFYYDSQKTDMAYPGDGITRKQAGKIYNIPLS